MRISTGMIFQRGLDAMQKQQSSLFQTQQHIAANKRVIRPSDDPVAASRAVETTQAKALNKQYADNQAAARDALALGESTLGNIGDVLQDARVLLVNATNGSLTADDRKSLALDLKAKLDQLIGLANTRDGAGGYLFAGYQEQAQPFTPTAAGAQYNGDQGRRELQVAPGRTLAVSENGVELFERLREGNGTFVTASATANTGNAAISVGRATGQVSGALQYQVEFALDANGAMTYTIFDSGANVIGAPDQPYTSGAAISIDTGTGALEFEISGEPAAGDIFTIEPAGQKNVFAMLSEAIAVLERPLPDGAARAAFTEDMARSLQNVDNAFDRVLSVRTAMGASLRELDALNNVVQDNALHYEERLSELIDLDYAAALTQLVREQMALEAAQLSYQRVTSLSLFNYL